jgi:predicted TPR repeat methyltransferase
MMTDPQHDTTADRVEQLFRAGRPQEAIDLCRRLCEAPEAKTEDWLLYGCVSADTGDNATAKMALGKAAELDPDSVEAQFGLGKLLAAAGDHAQAMVPLQKAVQLQPDNADIWLTLGITCGLAKQAVQAEECCRRSLALQPGSAPAHFNLANALQAQKKLLEAEAEYEATLEIEPRLATAWSMLSQARIGLGKPAEAEAAATHALSLEPRLGEAHLMLGNLLAARGEMEQARDHFRQAAELLPQFPRAHVRLGQILHHLGDRAGAADSYQRAVDLNPELAQAHFLMGELLNEQKFFGKAAMSYRKVLAVNNDHLQAHYRLAFLLVNIGRNAEAAKHFAEIVRLNPHDEQAQHMLAAQRGEKTTTAPASYVASLFDEVADTFDEKLVDTLNYHIPERLHEMVSQLVAPAAKSLDVIDLGCGTGLCAPLFRGMARTLHGVDLSPRMIEKARERNLYDTLEVGDITASLRHKASSWDFVIATDVFVYLGDLGEVFSACASALRPGGLFAFSVESGDDSDTFILRRTGRYAQARAYIRSLATAVGFEEVGHRFAVVRREKGVNVQGHLFLLRRPISLPESAYRIKYFFD